MLISLTLAAGPSLRDSGFDIKLSPVTVFVGPNNSGKSLALQEIANVCRGATSQHLKVVRSVTFKSLSEAEADAVVDEVASQLLQGELLQPDHVVIQTQHVRHQVPRQTLRQTLATPNVEHQRGILGQWILGPKIISLDGPARIGLVNQQHAGDLLAPPQSSFQTLLRDNTKRGEVQRIIKDALGIHFLIDPTNLGTLRIRFSTVAPPNGIERSLSEETMAFMNNATLVDQFSDGVKAFTGMVTEMVAGRPRVLLIDEPEAFLHPALARRLGQEVARAAKAEDRHVFISTHSPAFLMGCIQSGAPVTIVRLTYRDGVATSRVLTNDELIPLMRNPLLRSAGVMEALFFEHVVVTESDADRAFYQEINERLLLEHDSRGIPNCLFLNAQNKQTLKTIVAPLRALGIPVAAIADIDVLKDGGQVWTSLAQAASLPDLLSGPLGQVRGQLKERLVATGKEMKRDGGIDLLHGKDREAAGEFLDQLGAYGIFVVPGGELESWLKPLGASGHGPTWLVNMFSAMGEASVQATYVRPASDDVWSFMGLVSRWLLRPDRKGIPHS